MDNRTFGYARVSSKEQQEERQNEALTNFGVSKILLLTNALARLQNVKAISILKSRFSEAVILSS